MEDKNVNSNYKSIQQKQEQKRAKRKTQKRNRHMLVLVGLILLASGIYSMYGFLMTYAADIDIVEAASWDNVLTCRGWSFQQESVVITDLPGTVVPILNEGERISKGVEIGRFNYQNTESLSEPGNRRLYSPIAGILSYNVDGLEFSSFSWIRSRGARKMRKTFRPKAPPGQRRYRQARGFSR